MESRDPDRIPEVLELLGDVWKRHPELRLTQLILNYLHPEVQCPQLYGLEDDELLRRLGVLNPPPVRRVVVDLAGISSEREIHQVFASTLRFPDFYGANWDAFWDVLTGFDCFPRRLTIAGIDHLRSEFPDALSKMERCFNDCCEELGETAPQVTWR
jgi:ribonuclease inhibitor